MKSVVVAFAMFAVGVTVLQADCPTPRESHGWQYGIGINYGFPAAGQQPAAYTNLSITGLGIDGDVHDAFGNWTYANQTQNSSNVGFYFSSNGPFRVYAVRVNFPGVPFQGDPRRAAQTLKGLYEGTSILATASATFYFGSIAPDAAGAYPSYDQNAPNFHMFVKKVMLHEIGHTMWLTDQPAVAGFCGGQTNGQSVMNGLCGTNDSQNTIATSVTACDSASIY